MCWVCAEHAKKNDSGEWLKWTKINKVENDPLQTTLPEPNLAEMEGLGGHHYTKLAKSCLALVPRGDRYVGLLKPGKLRPRAKPETRRFAEPQQDVRYSKTQPGPQPKSKPRPQPKSEPRPQPKSKPRSQPKSKPEAHEEPTKISIAIEPGYRTGRILGNNGQKLHIIRRMLRVCVESIFMHRATRPFQSNRLEIVVKRGQEKYGFL